MKIKTLKELNGKLDKHHMFMLYYEAGYVSVISTRNEEIMITTNDVEDLIPFGFDIQIMEYVDINVLTQICEENMVNPTYCVRSRKWLGRNFDGKLINIDSLLREYNYCI